MKNEELMSDFERLREPATVIAEALEGITNGPADSIMVLAMVAAFIINCCRKEGTNLEDAQKPFFNIVKLLSALGEDSEPTAH
jgi:hypothetical protein